MTKKLLLLSSLLVLGLGLTACNRPSAEPLYTRGSGTTYDHLPGSLFQRRHSSHCRHLDS
jgi:hypothetical protein